MVNRLIRFCLENKFIVAVFTAFLIVWGVLVAPFDWEIPGVQRFPIPVDAIPDIGENQQIVFTAWEGRSPQDIEDQISYPLTVRLLGVPGVKTVRSYSMFGFSTLYVIFEEDIEFYWSRSRILEKLASLPRGSLPEGVQPSLGPDATALGQVFWYTLEGRDIDGNPTGGWDLDELRSIQDWYVRYGLMAVDGISEVASVGGFVKEYQIDVDPDAMFVHGVTLADIYKAVQMSNIDVGARTIEVNKVEYVVRGLGFIENIEDIEQTVVKVDNNIPLKIRDVATVALGPAIRRGALDKEGAEAVGGVAVVRFGENPLTAIDRLKEKIAEISPGLPEKVLTDGTVSKVSIIPFYDRTKLIHETLDTLNNALTDEILITIIVVLIMVMNFRSAFLISGLLPLAVLFSFIGMKVFGVDANVVALSGIAIAIGTIVDMGIVLTENIIKHLDASPSEKSRLEVIYEASAEVSGAILTAISTTIISFLPVFTMEAAEGKLFKPLAFTKTFALLSSVGIALIILPPLAHLLFTKKSPKLSVKKIAQFGLILLGGYVLLTSHWLVGIVLIIIGSIQLFKSALPTIIKGNEKLIVNGIAVLAISILLTQHWMPLGFESNFVSNYGFVFVGLGCILGFFFGVIHFYPKILRWCLDNKLAFLSIPTFIIVLGLTIWLGFNKTFGFLPKQVMKTKPMVALSHSFPGLGKEFMPYFDEGSFLYMPTTMPHASIGETMDVLQKLDKAMYNVPEVHSVVGKLGRAETPLDPAPVSMIESVINIIPEYETVNGKKVRQWRDHIQSMDDIWNEIVDVAQIPGTTSAPKLMPIATRIVMLQSGMRAPMGIKVKGPNLETIETVSLEIESLLKDVPGVKSETVFADRIVGKPYLEIEIDREAIARYGLHIRQVQDMIEIGIGGKRLTTTVEGRERYPVRVRYARELREDFEDLERLLVPTPTGQQIPLTQLAEIKYVRGPQVIKSEDTFLIGYVIFDKLKDFAEVNVVESVKKYLQEKIKTGELTIPSGVSYEFTGSYENQVRASKRLSIVLPMVLAIIILILYLQFKSLKTSSLIFIGIFVAWSGGFILLWLYNQPWFLNVFGFRELFNIGTMNLSVAVWVGFLALFGIATDDGVLIATYLDQRFAKVKPNSIQEIKEATLYAGMKRVRPAMMTSATTILALIPILSSTGRGSDIMVPMAIPTFGGMLIVVITIFVVPTLYAWIKESELKRKEMK